MEAESTPTEAESTKLARKLSEASVRKLWDVYTAFDWPKSVPMTGWTMSPELISIYGTELYDSLSEEQQKVLSFFEVGNFFSLVLQGERPLVQGLVHRLYGKTTDDAVSDYLHHFIDEENRHMVMFGLYCQKYLGKVYPDKKMAFPRKYAKGEEEVAFFCKVLVVEEIGDYYNLVMMRDDRIHPIVKQLNHVHHVDEARHLAFGRQYLKERFAHHVTKWSDETLEGFRSWLVNYLESSWGDYYNPTMYQDAGLTDGYDVRQLAFSSEYGKQHRRRAMEKLVGLFLEAGILEKEPEI
jgi:hypothetical protein